MTRALPQAVIFDWDNTIVDTFDLLYAATNTMRTQFGKPALSPDEARRSIRKSARDALPELFGDAWQDAYKVYIDYVKAHHLRDLRFFAGAADMVAFLNKRGVKLGVFSNKTNTLLRAEVEKFDQGAAFDKVVGSGDFVGAGKPDPVGLIYTAGLMGLDKKQFDHIWYVGDTESDIKTAKSAGMVPVFIENDPMSDDDEIAAMMPQYRFKNCAECLAHLATVS